MGSFNSDDHSIYDCRQESLRGNGVALIVNQSVWNAVLGCNLKNDRMISVCFLQTLEMVILNTYIWHSDHYLFFIIEYVMKLIIRIWSLWKPVSFHLTGGVSHTGWSVPNIYSQINKKPLRVTARGTKI